MSNSMRPGITVDYTALPASLPFQGRGIGVAASLPGKPAGEALSPVRLSSLAQAREKFGEEGELPALLRAVFGNALCEVFALPTAVGDEAEKMAALRLLFAEKEPYCILCGGGAALLREARTLAAESEKLFFAPAIGDAALLAEELNCARVLLAAPPVLAEDGTDVSHALLAALTARQESPLSNLFGEGAEGSYTLPAPLGEAALNELLCRGVTVFEPGDAGPEVIRAVTTRTRDDSGKSDLSLRNLSVLLVIDRVNAALRSALQIRLLAGPMSVADVSAALEWELWLQREGGLLSGYDKPLVLPDPDDETRCRARVAYRVRQGPARIEIHAQITV